MKLKIFFALCCCFLLNACYMHLTNNQLAMLHRDMTPDEVHEITKLNPQSVYEITLGDTLFHFHKYQMRSGSTPVSSPYVYSGFGPDGMAAGYGYGNGTTPASVDYFFLYQNGKLLFWGYPYEYNREGDPVLNKTIGLMREDANKYLIIDNTRNDEDDEDDEW